MKKIPIYWENDFKYNVSKVSQIIKGFEKKDLQISISCAKVS